MRDFDPARFGGYEADAWVSYYQRRWITFLRSAIGMVRTGFGMSWPRTIRGAWLVMRANQAWAPFPDNDPVKARAFMRAFYVDVARTWKATFDVDRAATLEIGWWAVHRRLQHEDEPQEPPGNGIEPLVDAVASLYAHVYGVDVELVRPAAAQRAEAMIVSDAWVAAGRDPASPDIARERELLISGYALLHATMGVPSQRS